MTKTELNKLRYLDKLIKYKTEQLESLKDISTGCTNFTGTKGSSTNSTSNVVENTTLKIIELENLIKANADELISLRITAENEFKKLNGVYSCIMNLRYLNNKSYEYIAEEMHYTVRHIQRMHDEACNIIVKMS